LLVVIGIIGLLISILLPALRQAREHANAVACASNQRQLMSAFLMFANDHKQRLPGNFYDGLDPDPDKHSWLINAGEPFENAPQNGTLYPYLNNMQVYRCPSQLNSWLNANVGSNGRFDYASFMVFSGTRTVHVKLPARFTYADGRVDNSVYTPIVCEEEPLNGINGGNAEGGHCNSDQIGHPHNGGGYYGSIDGSVHFFKEPRDGSAWNWTSESPHGYWIQLGNIPNPSWGWWDAQ
jgi:type II secretory pathway pseudopilin PulG